MRLPIRRVIVLIRIPIQVWLFHSQLTRDQDRAIRAFSRIGQYQLRSQHAQDGKSFRAGTGRDCQRDRDTKHGTERGVRDAHVAEVEIEQAFAIPEVAVSQGGPDNVECGSVLDRTARVEPFSFGKDLYTRRQAPA